MQSGLMLENCSEIKDIEVILESVNVKVATLANHAFSLYCEDVYFGS